MTFNLADAKHALDALLIKAQKKDVKYTDIQEIAAQAADLQIKIEEYLDGREKKETAVALVQSIFDVREYVWDTIAKINTIEIEHPGTSTPQKNKKGTKKCPRKK